MHPFHLFTAFISLTLCLMLFFRLNTDTETSVFDNHTGYWILVFSFCTGQVKLEGMFVLFIAKIHQSWAWLAHSKSKHFFELYFIKTLCGLDPNFVPFLSFRLIDTLYTSATGNRIVMVFKGEKYMILWQRARNTASVRFDCYWSVIILGLRSLKVI